MAAVCAGEEGIHHRIAAVAGDVHVIGAGILQRQADELAAPLDAAPVVKLVGHGSGSA
jgi:hypothetical protein